MRRPSEPMRVRGRHEGFEPLVSWRLAWRTRPGGPRRPPPLLDQLFGLAEIPRLDQRQLGRGVLFKDRPQPRNVCNAHAHDRRFVAGCRAGGRPEILFHRQATIREGKPLRRPPIGRFWTAFRLDALTWWRSTTSPDAPGPARRPGARRTRPDPPPRKPTNATGRGTANSAHPGPAR